MTAAADLTALPLSGLRVVDLVKGPLAPITRYLSELGACVTRIETVPAPVDDVGDFIANHGKRRLAGSLDEAWAQDVLAAADAIVTDLSQQLDLTALRASRPRLVTMSVTDFGVGNSLSTWRATDAVLHALSGGLSRSGIRGRPPLLPPGNLALQCAISQGAYALIVSIYHALRTGTGDHLDFSALEAATQALDPGFGISGSATMGKPAHLLSRDRPHKGIQYPILPCADGYVRICLLAKRQWQGMFRWMGEPAAFASPEFNSLAARYKSPDLLKAIAEFFATRRREELEERGQHYGVPISAVLTLEQSMRSEHVVARRSLRQVNLGDGSSALIPNGVISIDGSRMASDHCEAMSQGWAAPATALPAKRAFEGLRVLDLGVIVVGAEQGRLFADQGGDVIKVESRAYPDGNRQSYLSYGLSVSFAAGHRNKRSLGLNLRDPEGKAIFLRLAARADVILSNFKPGTLESLGLGHEAIFAVNPRVVITDSSAFGASGPWSGRMGYGPLVRAATGLTMAWRYPDDADSFSDSTTIYPDHVAARIGALATVALLIRRLRTGRGGSASIAQSEVMISHFGVEIAKASRGEPPNAPPDWPWSAYPAQGDDEWCVVSVENNQQWLRLCAAMGFRDGENFVTPSSRLTAREEIDAVLSAWLAERSARDAAALLQEHGVPAAPMLRIADLPSFPCFAERRFFREESHPYLVETVVAECRHVFSENLSDAPTRPAPLMGEQSEEVLQDWLGASSEECATLISAGVLEPVEPSVLAEVMNAKNRSEP